ncbi:hypothetical protein N825_05640 [Skermanella stibiiresistens SB22]|uniref:Histidine kinase/HSP90-like ATPase domain-containing protein n=1 Tax=Skermanella stibiiresistens SB22 TaxID=1385369 RepID=W9H0H8_9PROT|nr:ATP-binding protein [Skermanella stibiiresistens]EWY39574.1 hypothetical protein N825_05640 [Skermanella stibiiresistens SB22]
MSDRNDPIAVAAGTDMERVNAVLSDIGLGAAHLIRFTLGHPAASRTNERSAEVPILLLGNMTTERLSSILYGPHRIVVEFPESGSRTGLTDRLMSDGGANTFRLSVTTATAFKVECAKLVCDALAYRGVLPESSRFQVEIALHEIVANAILHGNLEIESHLKARPEQYETYCAHLRERLAEPERGGRWIDIAAGWDGAGLSLSVMDQGNGFRSDTAEAMPEATGSFGRGLGIVRSIATDVVTHDGGRRTVMWFAHDK